MYLEEGSWILAIEKTNMHSVFHLTTTDAYDKGKKYAILANWNFKKKNWSLLGASLKSLISQG